MIRKIQKQTEKQRNPFDFSNDPLKDLDVDQELAINQSHTGYRQSTNGQMVPTQNMESENIVVSDEDEFEGDDEDKIVSADKDVMKAVIDEMTPEQADRFEVYRRFLDHCYSLNFYSFIEHIYQEARLKRLIGT